jgi:mannose-6-phosphate isomerase-like protein (cupin superfamily)
LKLNWVSYPTFGINSNFDDMKKLAAILLFSFILSAKSFGQNFPLTHLSPNSEFENIHVQNIYSDSLSSSFVIWVKKSVRPHYHAEHTEAVTVLNGKGIMQLGDSFFKIRKGSVIIIPKGTVHSVEVTSRKPLLVLSVQAPEFKGKDRIFVKDE